MLKQGEGTDQPLFEVLFVVAFKVDIIFGCQHKSPMKCIRFVQTSPIIATLPITGRDEALPRPRLARVCLVLCFN